MPATPNEKLLGRKLIVIWTPDIGDPVTLTVYSRNFSFKQSPKEIDVSTRADLAANTEDIAAGVPSRELTIGGLDSDEDTPDYDLIDIGETGTIAWYRRGLAPGASYKYMTARVTGGPDLDSPYDNANTWSLTFKGTSAPAVGTVS